MSKDNSDKLLEFSGLDRLTVNARKLILQGYDIASKYNYEDYLPVHLFVALLSDEKNIVAEIFERLGVDVASTIQNIESKINDYKSLRNGVQINPKFSEEVKEIVKDSFVVASELGHVYVGSEHIALAFFKSEGLDFIKEMNSVGINFDIIKKTLASIGTYPLDKTSSKLGSLGNSNFPNLPNLSFPLDELNSTDSDALPYFCTDLTEKASEGGSPPITGRDKEIERLIHILARKTKNNPILVGEAGVGKTAIVEGFVKKIIEKEVPASFVGKKVLSLDIGSVLAGARLRGDVEERVGNIIKEVIEDENTILFIDEIHTIVGAGSAGNRDSMDIANILKPYLTDSELSIIGATTYDEYTKYFESDSALTRRFQPIFVNEIDLDSAKQVLRYIKKSFEEYHKVKIKEDALEVAVELSAKFIQDRNLPDKAIDIIDEAAASVKIGREIDIEPELSKLGEKLLKVQQNKEKFLGDGNYNSAAKLKKEEESIIAEIENVMDNGGGKIKKNNKSVDSSLVKRIIVDWTGIPIAASDLSDKKFKDLARKLGEKVIGQSKVIEEVSVAIQKSHLGLNDANRPLASFLFLGPTGVGKTELAKEIANQIFGSQDLLLRVDMSELMEKHGVSKLIGSPPGYVGYDEGGQLTTFVRRKPYSVIIFDEVEKAHPDILNLLLQILEEGSLTDSKGRKVSFKNTIIVMTSNIGAEKVADSKSLGFDVDYESLGKDVLDQDYSEMEGKILEELKFTLRPELLNRIDSVNVFRGLSKEDSLEITKLRVNDLIKRLIPRGIVLEVSEGVVNMINEEGYNAQFGGRNIRRKVQEILEDGLAKFLIESKFKLKKNKLLKISVDLSADKSLEFLIEKS